MHASYSALLVLGGVYSIYLAGRYFGYYYATSGEEAPFERNPQTAFNSSPVFVALIQREDSPNGNVKAARETWLNGVDNYVFTEQGGTWYDRSRIRFPPAVRGDLLEVRWIAAYMRAFLSANDANWFVVVPDTSYVVLENLLPLLVGISTKTPAYALLETASHNNMHMLVLNRPAMEFLAEAHALNLCASYHRNALQSCLTRLGHAERVNLENDGNGRMRYLVQTRHMSLNELKENTKNGQYSDGATEFAILGDYAHSFHNLEAKELRWFHIMIYGMKRVHGRH